jgi:hypothetical protein
VEHRIAAPKTFLDQDGKLVNVEILDPQKDTGETIFYFGFGGDTTGDYVVGITIKDQEKLDGAGNN